MLHSCKDTCSFTQPQTLNPIFVARSPEESSITLHIKHFLLQISMPNLQKIVLSIACLASEGGTHGHTTLKLLSLFAAGALQKMFHWNITHISQIRFILLIDFFYISLPFVLHSSHAAAVSLLIFSGHQQLAFLYTIRPVVDR